MGFFILFLILHNVFVEEDEKMKKDRESKKFSLPDDWDIPVTTQRYSYRDPTMLNTAAAKPLAPVKPTNNLEPDGKIFGNIHIKRIRAQFHKKYYFLFVH